jgi:hypothetical protein
MNGIFKVGSDSAYRSLWWKGDGEVVLDFVDSDGVWVEALDVRPADEDAPWGDCTHLSTDLLVLSERARELLADLVGEDGRWIPVRGAGRSFVALYVTSVVDVLDEERSKIRYLPSGGVFQIEEYRFRDDAVSGAPNIFRIPQTTQLLVKEAFRRRVAERGLLGFEFVRVA